MKIYVGRWDLLPEDWEGINGLYDKNRFDIERELSRQITECPDDTIMGVYYPFEFEETFNQDMGGRITTKVYWIKIF